MPANPHSAPSAKQPRVHLLRTCVTPLKASGTETEPAAPNTPSTFSIGPAALSVSRGDERVRGGVDAGPAKAHEQRGRQRLPEPAREGEQENGGRHQQRPRGKHARAPRPVDDPACTRGEEQLSREERQQQPRLRVEIEPGMLR